MGARSAFGATISRLCAAKWSGICGCVSQDLRLTPRPVFSQSCWAIRSNQSLFHGLIDHQEWETLLSVSSVWAAAIGTSLFGMWLYQVFGRGPYRDLRRGSAAAQYRAEEYTILGQPKVQ